MNLFIYLFNILFTPCPGLHPRANLASHHKVNIAEHNASATWNTILSMGNISEGKISKQVSIDSA